MVISQLCGAAVAAVLCMLCSMPVGSASAVRARSLLDSGTGGAMRRFLEAHAAGRYEQRPRPSDPPAEVPAVEPAEVPAEEPAEALATPPAETPEETDPVVVPPLPIGAPFDYQIGGAYDPPAGTQVVSRDWYYGDPLEGTNTYSICYVNAFQTQPDGEGDRADLLSNWPAAVVNPALEDPNWPGEYLIDISTSALREIAAEHVQQMLQTCSSKGFQAVEFDNYDSYYRFDNTGFGEAEAVAYATLLVEQTHALGMAAAQKNAAELLGYKDDVGFDFVVVESCGEWDECIQFRDAYGGAMVGIEYSDGAFSTACSEVGDSVAIVRRDVSVSVPGAGSYVIDQCGP